MILEKYSVGMGDRFAHQGRAQLGAVIQAKTQGVAVVPVWNKSHREHTTVHTEPADLRREADEAVNALGWEGSYHVDADHIGLGNVSLFVDSSDFFTLDVANAIGRPPGEEALRDFIQRHRKYVGSLAIPGIDKPFEVTEERIATIAGKFLMAAREAGEIYRLIQSSRGEGNSIIEVSIDETDEPQTPVEMFFILAALADQGVPLQTIAPKFTGRFNKGVDYVGDVARFTEEFESDLAVIAFAIAEFGLPSNLKISIHSGSDKFSLYGPIRRALRKFDAGVHLKTSGTTWLEELIGLGLAGGEGLAIAKEIYGEALGRFEELVGPYSTVTDIDPSQLPAAEIVSGWTSDQFADALRHDSSCDRFNPHLRQILHVAYKLAAEMGARYLNALDRYEDIIGKGVDDNLYQRHLKPVFIDE